MDERLRHPRDLTCSHEIYLTFSGWVRAHSVARHDRLADTWVVRWRVNGATFEKLLSSPIRSRLARSADHEEAEFLAAKVRHRAEGP